MKITNKSGIVLIYVLFLLSIWSVMWVLVFKNSFVYYNNIEYQNILENLHTNIYTKKDTAFKLVRTFNSNGSGYTDNISCPQNVTMSWSVFSGSAIPTSLDYTDWVASCIWTYNRFNFHINFNSNYDNFSNAEYRGSYVTLTWTMFWEPNFSWLDTDSTQITFLNNWTNLKNIDNIDDNFNSDDYRVVSTWSSSTGVLYPNNFIDDDVLPREVIFWYIWAKSIFKNILWSNDKINTFIANNSNNDDILHEKMWNVGSWMVILTVNWNYDLKLVKFSKSDYNNLNTLRSLEVLNWINLTWNWYIQNNSKVLSTSITKTWNEYIFDFKNNDYALFLKNIWQTNLSYNVSAETTSWTGIYISPIDDSWNQLRFFWADIYIDPNGKYSSTSFIITWSK